MLYLLHFDERYQHAQHYLGWTTGIPGLQRRLLRHERGTGAALLRRVQNAGIIWRLVRTWPEGERTDERRIKRQGGLSRHCPICRATGNYHK